MGRRLGDVPASALRADPQMLVHDGDAAVRGYYAETRTAFPDQDHEIIALRLAPTR